MFEEEAEDYALSNIGRNDLLAKAFQDGAEYGYNKANEWHYIKNELPIGKPYQNGTKAFVTVAYINNYNVPRKLDCYYWNNEFLCDSTYGYKKVEDVYGKVYAWKYEDKLPELKEK